MHLWALAQKAQALAELDAMDKRKEIEAAEMLLKNKKEQVCLKIQIRKADALVALSSNSSNSHVSIQAQKWQERVEANQDKQQKSTADENSVLVNLVEQNLKLCEALMKNQNIQSNKIKLPPSQITKFDGDPLKYQSFIKTYKNVVDDNEDDPQQCLFHLIARSTGSVRIMLEGCQYDEPAKGFLQAKQLLEEKFGDPIKVHTAAMSRVSRCSAISTGRNQLSSLEHFATALCALIYMTESRCIMIIQILLKNWSRLNFLFS